MAKRPKQKSVSEEVFELAQELLKRELTHYRDHPEDGRVPSALLSAGLASGKATGIAEKVADETRREEAQAASGTFRSRITDEELSNRTVHTVITSVEQLCSVFNIEPTDYCSIAWMAKERSRSADGEEQATLLKIAEDAESKAAGE